MEAAIYAIGIETKEGNKIVFQSADKSTAKDVQSSWEGSTMYYLGEKCTNEKYLYVPRKI